MLTNFMHKIVVGLRLIRYCNVAIWRWLHKLLFFI